jgi:hypothetical protein
MPVDYSSINRAVFALNARCARELRRLGQPPACRNGGWSVDYVAESLAIRDRYDALINRAIARG